VADPAEILSEARGRWILPVVGGEVSQVRIDFAFGLVIEVYGDESVTVVVRISTPFVFHDGGTTATIDPENTAGLGALLTLHKAEVTEAYVVKDGHLHLTFADGRSIEVAPHDQYEAWQVEGHKPPIQRRFSLIGLPSGVARL
jgi:hypothetical protein